MDNKKYRYLMTFNELASILRYEDLIDSYCRDVKDCEKTLDIILCFTERMKRLIKVMEE
jgi:hypothetical protein